MPGLFLLVPDDPEETEVKDRSGDERGEKVAAERAPEADWAALGADDAYGTNTGFSKVRGTAGRTPTIWALDLGAQYTFKIWKSNLALRADIFNVTNEQRTTTVDQTYNTVNTDPHQNYPYFKMETAHQTARQIRLAIRWTF